MENLSKEEIEEIESENKKNYCLDACNSLLQTIIYGVTIDGKFNDYFVDLAEYYVDSDIFEDSYYEGDIESWHSLRNMMQDSLQRIVILSVDNDFHFNDRQFHKCLKLIVVPEDDPDIVVEEGLENGDIFDYVALEKKFDIRIYSNGKRLKDDQTYVMYCGRTFIHQQGCPITEYNIEEYLKYHLNRGEKISPKESETKAKFFLSLLKFTKKIRRICHKIHHKF